MRHVQVQRLESEYAAEGRIAIGLDIADKLGIGHRDGVLVTTDTGDRTALTADTRSDVSRRSGSPTAGREGTAPTVGLGRYVWAEHDVEQGDTVSIEPLTVAPATEATVVFRDVAELHDDVRHAIENQLRGRAVLDGGIVPLVATSTGEPTATAASVCVANVSVPDRGRAFRITTDTEIVFRKESTHSERRSGRVQTSGGLATVGGYRRELKRLRQVVECALERGETFDRLGMRPPNSVLLYGPPGTGKTHMTRAVADAADATLFVIDGGDVVGPKVGESERRLEERFEEAVRQAPSVLFVDEIDAIAPDRSEVGQYETRLVTALQRQLDSIDDHGEVAVVAATNRVDALDPAVRRGGRVDREIRVDPPSETERAEILQVLTRGVSLGDGVDLTDVAERTEGFVAADLETLVTEAGVAAVLEHDCNPSRVESIVQYLGDRPLRIRKSDFEIALEEVAPSALREHGFESPDVGWDDVGGLREQRATLQRKIELPATHTEAYEELGVSPSSGIILHGPPGTGKTRLAKALAGEMDANFLSVDGPELLERVVGGSSRNVREVFERARETAPTVILFDELDSLGSRRETSPSAAAHNNVVSQLLTELDGLEPDDDIYVVGTTNRLDTIDPALRRPGRFGTELEVGKPDVGAREEILRIHTRENALGESVSIPALAEATAGYTGAELEELCEAAAIVAFGEELRNGENPDDFRETARDTTLEQWHFSVVLSEN